MSDRKCWKCGTVLALGETWTEGQKRSGIYCCRKCVSEKSRAWEKANRERVNARNREKYAEDVEAARLKRAAYYQANKDKWQAYHRGYASRHRADPALRAKRIATYARTRAKKLGVPFDLDVEFLIERFQVGACEVTGIPFVFSGGDGGSKKVHPYSPSLDRIEPSKGYTKGNVRVVTYIYNIARSEYSDEQVLAFARALVAKADAIKRGGTWQRNPKKTA